VPEKGKKVKVWKLIILLGTWKKKLALING